MIIVGIDISKRSHEAVIIDGMGNILLKPFRFQNNSAGFQKLLKATGKYSDDLCFGMEATGHYWLSLFARLKNLGHQIHVINPMQTDSLRNMYIRQSKNDTRDSFLVAEVIRFGRFSESGMPPSVLYTLRELSRNRFFLIDMRSDLKRKVVALLDQAFPEYETLFSDIFGLTSTAILKNCPTPKEILAMEEEFLLKIIQEPSRKRFGMAKVKQIRDTAADSFGIELTTDFFSGMIKSHVRHIDFITGQIGELESQMIEMLSQFDSKVATIIGIGPVLAAVIISEIGEISRFSCASKLAAFAGVDPTMKQSGEYMGTRNRMSKRGSPYLRRAIWLAATVAAHHDPALHAFYLKKREEGKPYMTTIGHICRKLTSIIYAIMRDNKEYLPVLPG